MDSILTGVGAYIPVSQLLSLTQLPSWVSFIISASSFHGVQSSQAGCLFLPGSSALHKQPVDAERAEQGTWNQAIGSIGIAGCRQQH